MRTSKDYKVGDVLTGPARGQTFERIEWYDSALLSACSGELRQAGANIHTDDNFAKDQGFKRAVSDGMIPANYASEMLIDAFGFDYLERGELRTKFIKPVFIDVMLHTKGRIKKAEKQPNGAIRYELDIWCEDQDGLKLVDGEAFVETALR
jgi:3-hydroxybutyryl-CoA dehydratase